MGTTGTLESRDVVVVGSGMVGIATALELQKRGRQVVVVDPGDPWGRASYGNSGVISRAIFLPMSAPDVWGSLPQYALNRTNALRINYVDLPHLTPWVMRFLRECNTESLYKNVAALERLVAQAKQTHIELAIELGTRAWLRDTGWLRVWRSDTVPASMQREQHFYNQYGIDHEVLAQFQIQELEPALKDQFQQGLFVSDAMVLPQPGRIVEKAREAFLLRGGSLITGKVAQWEQQGDQVVVRTNEGQVIRAKQAVLAAGAQSNELAQSLGYRIPMVAGRGYHVHYPLPGQEPFSRSITNVSDGYGIGPEPGGVRLVTGIELSQVHRAPNYVQLTKAIQHFSTLLNLELSTQPTLNKDTVWSGSRPMTADGLPILTQAPKHDRVYFAFGHSHLGLATGPATGRLMAQLLTGESTDIDLASFSLQRFN